MFLFKNIWRIYLVSVWVKVRPATLVCIQQTRLLIKEGGGGNARPPPTHKKVGKPPSAAAKPALFPYETKRIKKSVAKYTANRRSFSTEKKN